MQKHKEIVRFLGDGCVWARVRSILGLYGVRIPPGAARFLNISASQTLLLALLSARAIRFPTRFGPDFLKDLSSGDP